jgi:hypothetical protein
LNQNNPGDKKNPLAVLDKNYRGWFLRDFASNKTLETMRRKIGLTSISP